MATASISPLATALRSASGGHRGVTINSSNVAFVSGSTVLFNTRLSDTQAINLSGRKLTATVVVTRNPNLGIATGNGVKLVEISDRVPSGTVTLDSRAAGAGSAVDDQNRSLHASGISPEVSPDKGQPLVVDRLGVVRLARVGNRDVRLDQVCAGAGVRHAPQGSCNTMLWAVCAVPQARWPCRAGNPDPGKQ